MCRTLGFLSIGGSLDGSSPMQGFLSFMLKMHAPHSFLLWRMLVPRCWSVVLQWNELFIIVSGCQVSFMSEDVPLRDFRWHFPFFYLFIKTLYIKSIVKFFHIFIFISFSISYQLTHSILLSFTVSLLFYPQHSLVHPKHHYLLANLCMLRLLQF